MPHMCIHQHTSLSRPSLFSRGAVPVCMPPVTALRQVHQLAQLATMQRLHAKSKLPSILVSDACNCLSSCQLQE